jgi:GTPase
MHSDLSPELPAIPPDYRAGYVTLMGDPNVGKSTLVNTFLQQKISIVTHKPQTTRHRILGILSAPKFQVVFLDTPGIITPKYLLQEVMMQSASTAIADADLLIFIVDATRPPPLEGTAPDEAFARLAGIQRPVFLVINKIDLVDKGSLLPAIEAYARSFPFREIFPISALKADGTDALLAAIPGELPEHPPYFPTDIASEQSERFFVGEIIREKIFLKTHEEIPYSTTVDIVEFKERAEGKWYINADIIVERESQKGILIGRQGAMLKEIGQSARHEVERFLAHPVFLELHVKVRGGWREKEEWLRRLGYDRPGPAGR